jgi:hypothetical protein
MDAAFVIQKVFTFNSRGLDSLLAGNITHTEAFENASDAAVKVKGKVAPVLN